MALRNTLAVPLLFVCVMSGCAPGLSDNNINLVVGEEVRGLIDNAAKPGRGNTLALVDPRSPADFEAGHLPRAINVEPIQHGQKPPKAILNAREVIVYGRDPGDALARGMTKRLMEAGVNSVRLYAGGLREWWEYHQPIEPEGADPFPGQTRKVVPEIEAVSTPAPK